MKEKAIYIILLIGGVYSIHHAQDSLSVVPIQKAVSDTIRARALPSPPGFEDELFFKIKKDTSTQKKAGIEAESPTIKDSKSDAPSLTKTDSLPASARSDTAKLPATDSFPSAKGSDTSQQAGTDSLATALPSDSARLSFKESATTTLPESGDTKNIPPPKSIHLNVFENAYKRQITDQSIRFFDVARQLRRLFGKRQEAMNTDSFDEVPNSSWFTNRNHVKPLSAEELARGPYTGPGPDTSGNWTIWRAKADGFAPGFFIKDAKGERFIIKFDPLGYPELTTNAEVVTTKFFYAAGYNVPENFVTIVHKDRVKVGKKVKFTDERGVKRFLTKSDLKHIWTLVDQMPDGRVRCHASKFIKGKVLGPWKFNGTRPDDPNDIVPHEHRREIRGLRIITAWLNHYDTNLGNTFDSYVEENGRRFVRHYLIDFGSSLGASVWGPMPATRGKENMIQPTRMLINIASLGFWVHDFEKCDSVPHPSIGRWESHLFDPHRYKFTYPNLAFKNMTRRDAFWAAKIVMSFSDSQIKTLVETGQYSNPEAVEYISRIISERRDIIGKYYFKRINPIGKFTLKTETKQIQQLCFVDQAIRGNFARPENTLYHYSITAGGNRLSDKGDMTTDTCIDISAIPEASPPDTNFQVSISTSRSGKSIGKAVVILLKYENNGLQIAGVKR